MSFIKKPATWLVITILYSGFTFWLSSLPGRTASRFLFFRFKHADWVAHGAEYALLACCLLGYLWATKALRRWWWTLGIPIVVAGLIGAANELYQIHVLERSATVSDGVANIIGATMPVMVCLISRCFRSKRRE